MNSKAISAVPIKKNTNSNCVRIKHPCFALFSYHFKIKKTTQSFHIVLKYTSWRLCFQTFLSSYRMHFKAALFSIWFLSSSNFQNFVSNNTRRHRLASLIFIFSSFLSFSGKRYSGQDLNIPISSKFYFAHATPLEVLYLCGIHVLSHCSIVYS